MSLEKITDKILSEAEETKRDLLKAAHDEAEQILAEAKEEAQKILDDAETRGHMEREKIIGARNAVINVDVRKLMLEKKQQVLRETFEKAGVDFEEYKRELQAKVADILFKE